jgi:tRNA/rRNA methyltransferase
MSATRPAVILVRTQEEGNIGAAARAMANMGLEQLLLVAPRAPVGDTARAFAVGARDVLENARVVSTLAEAPAPFQRVVGTTSARGRGDGGITARDLPAVVAGDAPGTAAALVFGPEASGLTADELALCSPIVQVPCALRQPTLNVAQAVLVVSYELFEAGESPPRRSGEAATRATAGELAGLLDDAAEVLGLVGFARDSTFDGVLADLRSLAARSGLTPREVSILRGVCRRARHRLPASGGDPTAEGR